MRLIITNASCNFIDSSVLAGLRVRRLFSFHREARRDWILSRPAELGSVKEGSYIILEGEPCKIVSREHFKPGKHGSAKVRLVAISITTGS